MSKAQTIELIENFSDPLWRLNNLYWCVTEKGEKVPFRMNGAQQRLFDDLWYFNLVLKSRQHGFTTFISIIGLDLCLFQNNLMAGTCAHTREDVEKIFKNKIKFVYDELPDGLRNARLADTDTAKKLAFNNGSSIEVATSLRSGTYQFAHISEFGKICAKYPDKAREIVTGTFETVHPGCLLFIESTAEGREGYFYRYVQKARNAQYKKQKLNKLQFKLHFFPWFEDHRNTLEALNISIGKELNKYFKTLKKDHGIKLTAGQKAWYAAKYETLEDDIKREHPSTVDEAFEAAVTGAYLAKQMTKIRKENKITIVPHDPSLAVNTGWDFGIGDTMSIWFHQVGGFQHRLIRYMSGTDDDVLYYWREMQRMPYTFGNHFLPHDADTRRIGTAKSADDKPQTLKNILETAGMNNIKVVPKVENKFTAIQEVRLFLPLCWIDEQECEEGINGLDNFRRDWDDKLGDWKNHPLHNWAMHPYDAFETLARGIRKFGCSTSSVKYTPNRNVKARRA